MRTPASSALALCAFALTACGSGTPAHPRPVSSHAAAGAGAVSVTLARSRVGRHGRVSAVITTRRATGVSGDTRTNYTLSARAVEPAAGCVNDRDRRFPDGARGVRVRADLDPARGEGGPAGWCPGRYRGTVVYFSGFACPPKGSCHPPKGFPTRSTTVARFSFRVR
jgi:hypothetical protein